MRLLAEFETASGAPADGVWAAPGRVNVIGEHTDYSDGFVLPMALPQSCLVAARLRNDGVLRVASCQQDAGWLSYPADAGPDDVHGWTAYAAGIVWALRELGHELGGADLMLDSEVPLGAGLSSSAAVGCSVALALTDLLDLPLSRIDLAALARRSENEFVGAPTGAMDQAISLLGTADHLLFLDTRDMRSEQIPFALEKHGLSLLVIDSRTSHALTDGGYGSRRAAVEEGARALGVPALRDVPAEGLAQRLSGLPPVVASRVRHVVTENARVQEVVELLQDGGDPSRIGPALLRSHASMRDDFEISTPELDTAVEASMAAGAHGARMTGGGFGGCAIALVDSGIVDEIRSAVELAYAKRGFAAPGFLIATPSEGAHKLPS